MSPSGEAGVEKRMLLPYLASRQVGVVRTVSGWSPAAAGVVTV